jgi:hypothetical protein
VVQASAGSNLAAGYGFGVTPAAPIDGSSRSAQSAPADPTVYAIDWAPRIALLEKFRDNLTLSKALATLLEITNPADFNLLIAHEGK